MYAIEVKSAWRNYSQSNEGIFGMTLFLNAYALTGNDDDLLAVRGIAWGNISSQNPCLALKPDNIKERK